MSNYKEELELISGPGDTIIETLEFFKMSQVELAERMGKTPSKINDLISGKEPITLNTAFLLEKVLGIDAQFWLNREAIYREKLSRIEIQSELDEYIYWVELQPIKDLKKWGYISKDKKGPELVEECLKFYGVANPMQWEAIYLNKNLSSRFRKSNKINTTLAGLAASLRIGEIEMINSKINKYDKTKFKESLEKIKGLIRPHPEDFATQLKDICANVGVAVVYTIKIDKAPISGIARWIGGNPLIQLTDRFKSNDHFWFSFFHEAGHILLHGKKDLFIEDFEMDEEDEIKENEANEFANKCLLTNDIEKEFSDLKKITEKEIRQVAGKYNTHSAIVLGRLQHLKIVDHSFGKSLKLKVALD